MVDDDMEPRMKRWLEEVAKNGAHPPGCPAMAEQSKSSWKIEDTVASPYRPAPEGKADWRGRRLTAPGKGGRAGCGRPLQPLEGFVFRP